MPSIIYTLVASRNLGVSATDTHTVWFGPYMHLYYDGVGNDGTVHYMAYINHDDMEEEFLRRCQDNPDVTMWEKQPRAGEARTQ